MKKNKEGNKLVATECKTTVLGVAKDDSFWDAETEVKTGDNVIKTHIKIFSLSNLFKRAQQFNL